MSRGVMVWHCARCACLQIRAKVIVGPVVFRERLYDAWRSGVLGGAPPAEEDHGPQVLGGICAGGCGTTNNTFFGEMQGEIR